MAPEALQHSRYSTKTDVYSYAITLIEILSRKGPYPNVDAIQVAIGNYCLEKWLICVRSCYDEFAARDTCSLSRKPQ
jgi:serine/threonine protein kinase